MSPETFIIFTPDRGDPSWSQDRVSVTGSSEVVAVEDLPQSAFIWRNFRVSVVFKVGGVDLGSTSARA